MITTESFNILKAFFVLRQRPDGSIETFYNVKGNYDHSGLFLADNGFATWADLGADWCAAQLRPYARLRARSTGQTVYTEVDYETPLHQWKFALRHLPHEIPGWVHVAKIKAECLRLLPAWADRHLVRGRSANCLKDNALAALTDARITQSGGHCWGFKNSIVEQVSFCDATYLHDASTGHIRTNSPCIARDDSTVHLYYLGQVKAYGQATIILHEGPDRRTGKFTAYGEGVKVFLQRQGKLIPYVSFRPEPAPDLPPGSGVNMPFNTAVE
jgi:hypothetical protein